MCPKIASRYVGCVDVHLFFIDISLLAVPEKIQNFVHYTNITVETRPNYPHFVTKEVRYKNRFDSLN